MKREWTNKIRFILDELVPPIIRDSKWFMWPFFVMAYGRLSVGDLMNFKSRAYTMSKEEYSDFYGGLGFSVSRRRLTDLNEASIARLIQSISGHGYESILDVGSGNGYLLHRLRKVCELKRLAGIDVASPKLPGEGIELHAGMLPSLPFKDGEFDVVTCTHVLEHVLDVQASVAELMRIARKKILVVVPRQRYYYYTLDEHLNFYPAVEPLVKCFSPLEAHVSLQDGDWVLEVNVNESGGGRYEE